MRWSGAMNTIAEYITPVVVQRLQTANTLDGNEKETKDKPVSISKPTIVALGRVLLTNSPDGLYPMGA